ncbi:cytochrome P450 [Novosphingobium sp. Gsoil 351]|uniref:cytochrome P450 n=1 Tax=Novosphingobium sp. Gsoil 351 TaxID=2675225 RepID=UPI0012B4CE23|nr:cytochrome P450 [Novosphingobium sp. Gsoil 351]QGN55651.1 cytochrome P450 [Novosphingobium sp. Gsoil 351]
MTVGPRLRVCDFAEDPYPIYARLRSEDPVSFTPDLGMYLVTRYDDVRQVLADPATYSTDSGASLIKRTFGEQILSLDGAPHDALKRQFQPLFTRRRVRDELEGKIATAAQALVASLPVRCDLRRSYAARLPVQVMLLAFQMPPELEEEISALFAIFERALADHGESSAATDQGADCARRLRSHFHRYARIDSPLCKDKVARNLSIIFFGGISTVEALILNALWLMLDRPEWQVRLRGERAMLPRFLEETVRWSGPVQSATRHVRRDIRLRGVAIPEGATVNAMIASANRDPAVFAMPDDFDPLRGDLIRHLGFAYGSHYCLGAHLALAEARIAIEALLDRFAAIHADGDLAELVGHEFRQPQALRCKLAECAA